jgi:NAD(P)-dependent dehydrogenase (short-subunit alcohol dehydrogenase family)
MMKTIFITGASSGLGKAAANLFARKGWKVIATMRNPEMDAELSKMENVSLLPLDVTDPQQIKSTVAKALTLSDVDVVFNNAGYGLSGPLEGISDAQLTRQINTNLLGVIRTTQAFIPYFRKKKSGLFITTTSIGGLIALPLNSVYHATKWALEGWSESMAFELNPLGIGIKTVAPGGIQTDFAGRSLDTGRHEAYEETIHKVLSEFARPERRANYSTPEQIAEVVLEAATDGKNQLRYIAGEDAKVSYKQRLAVGDEAFRKGVKELFSL